MDPNPSTNRYIVENDRPFAIDVARHRSRVDLYGCKA
jgi:hypothetical protein